MISTPYEFVTLDNFGRRLKRFSEKDKESIKAKTEEMLTLDPYRYPMLKGQIVVSGQRIAGLRHMKVGVSGVKGGAYILYRVCEECKKNNYVSKSDGKCVFCENGPADENKRDMHIVLFDVGLRSDGY